MTLTDFRHTITHILRTTAWIGIKKNKGTLLWRTHCLQQCSHVAEKQFGCFLVKNWCVINVATITLIWVNLLKLSYHRQLPIADVDTRLDDVMVLHRESYQQFCCGVGFLVTCSGLSYPLHWSRRLKVIYLRLYGDESSLFRVYNYTTIDDLHYPNLTWFQVRCLNKFPHWWNK